MNGRSLSSVAGFITGALMVAVVNIALSASPGDVIGVYDVPGGFITVFADTTARYEPENNGDE